MVDKSPGREAKGASWQAEFEKLAGAIRMRNSSATTLRTYRHWVAKFHVSVRSKAATELGAQDARAFLTELAVCPQGGCLDAESGIQRAALSLPACARAEIRPNGRSGSGEAEALYSSGLSRGEVDGVLAAIEPDFRLPVLLMSGRGLRLFECIGLRLHSFNLDEELLTIPNGKGQKDRSGRWCRAGANRPGRRNCIRKIRSAGMRGCFWLPNWKGNTATRPGTYDGSGFSGSEADEGGGD